MSEESHSRIRRRTVLQRLGVAASAVSLAGCNGLGNDSPDAEASDDETTPIDGDPTATETPREDSTPDEETTAGILSAETVEAGLLTFTEGPATTPGLQVQRGAELAVERLNANGGVGGTTPLRLEVKDEGSDPIETYRRFIEDGKDVTFGPISSGTHASMSPEVEQNEIINVGTDGGVTTLYERTNPDPTYSFRFQNYNVMETVSAARAVVDRMGASNIDTIAGVNPDYALGQDEMEVFTTAMQRLADVEVVYDGYPSLGSNDYSTHIEAIRDTNPDVVFSALWLGDAARFLEQAHAREMFSNAGTVVGTRFYSDAALLDESVVSRRGPNDLLSCSGNYDWRHPSIYDSEAGEQLATDAMAMADVTVPTSHFMSGYGAVMGWVAAVEAELTDNDTVTQDGVAARLEGFRFRTPAGQHRFGSDHQCRSQSYVGELAWDEDISAPVLDNSESYAPDAVSPPPGTDAESWLRELE